MDTIDYILLGGIALLLGGILFHLIKRKKQGKGGCGCGCQGCPSAQACQKRTEETHDETV